MARLAGFLEDDGVVGRCGVRLSAVIEDEDLCIDFFVVLAGDCLAFSAASMSRRVRDGDGPGTL